MKNNLKTDEGIITSIILVIVAIVALKYYLHFDLLAWLKTPTAQKIIQPAWTAIKNFYAWVDGVFRNHTK